MIKKFECVNIYTEDIKRLVEFYRDVLEIPVLEKGYDGFDGTTFGFVKGMPSICMWDELRWGKMGDGTTNLVFNCDDLTKTYQELKAKGVNLKPPAMAVYGEYELPLTDPDGDHILLLGE